MSDCRALYVEEAITGAVQRLLSGRVNEIFGEAEFGIPLIEFGGYEDGLSVVPVIFLSACERTEKERIIRLDAYTLTIVFALPESPESELYCYAYAAAVDRALGEDPALTGAASRTVLMRKKHIPPKKVHCGDGWEAVSLLQEQAPIEGDGVCKTIRKTVGVTGCVVTPLTIGTAPLLLYLAMGSAGLPPCLCLTGS